MRKQCVPGSYFKSLGTRLLCHYDLAGSCHSTFPLSNCFVAFMILCCRDTALPLSCYIASVMRLDTVMLPCHSCCCLATHAAVRPLSLGFAYHAASQFHATLPLSCCLLVSHYFHTVMQQCQWHTASLPSCCLPLSCCSARKAACQSHATLPCTVTLLDTVWVLGCLRYMLCLYIVSPFCQI